MGVPTELTREERCCLQGLADNKPFDFCCRPGVLERLQAKGLVEVIIQALPMFPLHCRYRITPLGKQFIQSLP